MKIRLHLLPLLLLAACGGSDGEETDTGAGVPPADIITASGDWLRGFVDSFDSAAVAAVRSSAGFLANNLTYTMNVPGHPVYDGTQRVRANALLAARVDYAHSTGLTGAGQTVAIIDDGILGSHEQFAGKVVTTFGAGAGDHGTRVASVAAGIGTDGALGIAPGADLFVAAMPFDASVDWRDIAGMVDRAAATGAIALNNSWSIGSVSESGTPAEVLSGAAGQAYIASLRNFTRSGVVVFSAQNDYLSDSINVMAAIPMSFPDLEDSFIAVINAIPTFNDERILSAERVSAPCGEAAAWCMAADGQIVTALNTAQDDYGLGSGASFAAPQVAGALALLAEAFPDLSPEQLRDRLLVTADNGFFEATEDMIFADGIVHGYNDEFGHGFLNLRDSLLPIGEARVPLSATDDGQLVTLGTPVLTGSPLTGPAIATSLGRESIVAIDALDGVFEVSGAALTSQAGPVSLDAWRLSSMMHGDLRGERLGANAALLSGGRYSARPALFAAPDAFALAGNAEQTIPLGEAVEVSLIGHSRGNSGVGLARNFEFSGGTLQIGLKSLEESGSVLGMTMVGHGVHGASTAVELGFAAVISGGVGLRVEAEYGSAEGTGAGLVRGFDNIRFDSLRLAVDRANVARDGDVLTLFAARPAAISGGSAAMVLPVTASAGVVSFETADVGLSPDARQIDFGVEYAAPLHKGEMRLGAMLSENTGHIAGQRDLSLIAGYQIRF